MFSDQLVANATVARGTSFDGVSYSTTSEDISGLLAAGTQGVNHGKPPRAPSPCLLKLIDAVVAVDIAQDGIVKLLTVTITS